MKRLVFALVVILLLGFLLSACDGNSTPTTPAPHPTETGMPTPVATATPTDTATPMPSPPARRRS